MLRCGTRNFNSVSIPITAPVVRELFVRVDCRGDNANKPRRCRGADREKVYWEWKTGWARTAPDHRSVSKKSAPPAPRGAKLVHALLMRTIGRSRNVSVC